MSFAPYFRCSDPFVDPEDTAVRTRGPTLHPAPKSLWDRLIWVICTFKGRSPHTINEFFIVADSPLPIEKRHSAFLFFRTYETRYYQARRKKILARGGIWYIERDGKAEEPIEPDNVPANMWPVSVELDDQSELDRCSCLIRVNGKLHEGFFGEVRCDWRVALHVTTEILHKISSVAEVQNQAAIHGGVFPEDWRYPERDELPREMLRPSMPVVNEFLEQVNHSPSDAEHCRRVGVVNIDTQQANSYELIDKTPVPRLSGCFRHLSHQAICDFLQSKRSGDTCTNFVILDKHTMGTRIKEPTFNPVDRTNFRGREWHCILGDTRDRKWGHLIMVRCALDSCAEVIDAVNLSGGGLCEYANDAAVEGAGFFRFPMDREVHRARKDQLDRDIEALRERDPTLFPRPSRARPPEKPHIKRESEGDSEHERDDALFRTSQPTPPPERRHKISDLRPNRDRDHRYSSSPECDYTSLFSQSFALSYDGTAAGRSSDAAERSTVPSFNLLASCTPEGSMSQRKGAWANDGQAVPSSQVTEADGSSSNGDGDVDDDFYDMRLPEATGSTQML